MNWFFEASFDPLGGTNKQKYVGLTEEQAKWLHVQFEGDGWGYVRSGVMTNGV
jgi:hypothetical protein